MTTFIVVLVFAKHDQDENSARLPETFICGRGDDVPRCDLELAGSSVSDELLYGYDEQPFLGKWLAEHCEWQVAESASDDHWECGSQLGLGDAAETVLPDGMIYKVVG